MFLFRSVLKFNIVLAYTDEYKSLTYLQLRHRVWFALIFYQFYLKFKEIEISKDDILNHVTDMDSFI